MNFDYDKLANAMPEQIETLLGLMDRMIDMELEKVRLTRELAKAIALELLWPGLWRDAKAEGWAVSSSWQDHGAGSISRRKPTLSVRVRKYGKLVEEREFEEKDVPPQFERPDWWRAKR